MTRVGLQAALWTTSPWVTLRQREKGHWRNPSRSFYLGEWVSDQNLIAVNTFILSHQILITYPHTLIHTAHQALRAMIKTSCTASGPFTAHHSTHEGINHLPTLPTNVHNHPNHTLPSRNPPKPLHPWHAAILYKPVRSSCGG